MNKFLTSAQARGIHPSLGAIRKILLFFGNPQDSVQTIHVAGTNGKGSVCAMLESIMRSAGYTTGLYTSPHLIRVHERIKYNGNDIQDFELNELLKDIQHACGIKKNNLTYFEILTSAAFLYFEKKKVDCAVIETGLGGRWDATNTIISPLATVLTAISKDHEQWLGTSLEKIAGEKAAIIKKHVPVVSAPYCNRRVESIIQKTCLCKRAQLYVFGKDFSATARHGHGQYVFQKIAYVNTTGARMHYTIPLAGPHQVINAAIACAAAEVLKQTAGFVLNNTALARGLKDVRWPGRFEKIQWKQGACTINLIIDSAHNPSAVKALVETWRGCGFKSVVLLLGVLKDKDYRSMIREVLPWVSMIRTVPVNHARGLSPCVLAQAIRDEGFYAVKPVSNWNELFKELSRLKNRRVIMAGSIYVISGLIKYLMSKKNMKGN